MQKPINGINLEFPDSKYCSLQVFFLTLDE
jgi:hypothetical protein